MNKILKIWNKYSTLHKIMYFVIGFTGFTIIRYISIYSSSKIENFSNPSSCTYYYMDGCGHCNKFNPEWEKFVDSYNGPIKLKKVEMKNASSDLKKYNIQGFPTILFLDETGNSKFYEGPRTSTGLNTFIDEN